MNAANIHKGAVGSSTALYADKGITLQAAQQDSQQNSSNSSSGFSAGIALSAGVQGTGFGITAGVNRSQGNADGNSTSWRDTHVGDAGSHTTIQTGDALTLEGAQVHGSGVDMAADSLHIQSQQDTGATIFLQQDARQQQRGESI